MYHYTNIPAFILRLAIFCLLFCIYPILNFFLRTMIKNIFWRHSEVSELKEIALNFSFGLIPLIFSLFYPDIGTILSYAGAVSGLIIIYCLPIFVHLKQMEMKIQNPLLAEAIAMNEFKIEKNPASPKIAITDEFLMKKKDVVTR